ncbi:MAG: Elongation factor Ts [Phycisphaerae bacterium]|nr:Elongation factor Ts [Phycisphaerae bacterium]
MEITAQMVKALREKTGLPMMDCKQAMQEAGGDEAKAIDILRKRGLGRVEKLAGRETSQGRVACHVDGGVGGIAEVRCETAPVAKTDDFQALCTQVARHAAAAAAPSPESLPEQPFLDDKSRTFADYLLEIRNRLRENTQIQRVAKLKGNVGYYVHHNGQVGVLVEMSTPCPPQAVADVCMHIAAMRPSATRREEIDAGLVAKERALAAEQVKGKPVNIVDKIVDGKINKWFSEIVLLEQPFVKDDKQSVGQYLGTIAPGLSVNRFVRYEVGGA